MSNAVENLNPATANQEFLFELMRQALAAVSAEVCLPRHLPQIDSQTEIIVLGAGKAAAAMAAVVERHYAGPCRGVVVTRYGHSVPTRQIRVLEAAHPLPDQASIDAAQQLLAQLDGINEHHVVIGLWSGGGSALLSLPAPGLSLADKQAVQRQLLLSGASIGEINRVRRQFSAIKGGHLALACYPARVYNYVLSDVPGDDAALVASGPMYADDSDIQTVQAILQRYQIQLNPALSDYLRQPRLAKPRADDERLRQLKTVLIANAQSALQAAANWAQQQGLACHILGSELEGEAQSMAKVHAAIVRQVLRYQQPFQAPCLILSGGEASVRVSGNGRGGRNAEFLLSLMLALRGQAGVYALAIDTDGIDGSEDNAGAWFGPACWQRAVSLGLDLSDYLDRHDSYSYFQALGNLIVSGPTLTNVNDFRAILILPESA